MLYVLHKYFLKVDKIEQKIKIAYFGPFQPIVQELACAQQYGLAMLSLYWEK